MQMRIASLLASGTEIAWALGLGDGIVAISHECDYPAEVLDRPRVTRPRFDPSGLSSGEVDAAVREAMESSGGVYMIDEDALRQLRPDLVLTQAVCDVCAVPASGAHAAVEALGSDAAVLSLDAHTIDGILETIRQIGEAADVPERAERYMVELSIRLGRVRERVADLRQPTVLGLEWLDPPFVPGHWVPEMVEIAGGVNLKGSSGRPSEQTTWDDLSELDPDVLLIMPCGYKLEAARRDADRYGDHLLQTAPRAIREGRAFVVDASSYFNRSGPRVVDGVEILAALLHPDSFSDVELEGRGARWRHPDSEA
jgi:iron complex transport system substrate-binding protein